MARDTMEPNAFIRKQLEEAEPDLLRELLHDVVDRIMGAEVDAMTGAAHGERTPGRTNRRNGYRERRWDTRVGTIDLRIPKLRKDSPAEWYALFPNPVLAEGAPDRLINASHHVTLEGRSFRPRQLPDARERSVGVIADDVAENESVEAPRRPRRRGRGSQHSARRG